MPGCKRQRLLADLENLVHVIDKNNCDPWNPITSYNPCPISPGCCIEDCLPCLKSPYFECTPAYNPPEYNPPPNICDYPTNLSYCEPNRLPYFSPPAYPPPYMPCCQSYAPCTSPNTNYFHEPQLLNTSKSCELINGVVYNRCLCEKRNGLQDECPRTQCRGRPECLTKPYPTCEPSLIERAKHTDNTYRNGNGYLDECQYSPSYGPPVQYCQPTCYYC